MLAAHPAMGPLRVSSRGNSRGAQIFINVKDNARLDWFSPGQSKHPVFGAIKDQASFDVVVKISKVRTRNDNPVEPIMMKSITITGL